MSFQIIKLEISEFEIDEFTKYINNVLRSIKNTKSTAKNIIEDLTKNTCLIQCDDLKYKFLHRSIPSYFAASCISHNASDEATKKFYKGSREVTKWEKWSDVLEFLKNIDKARFSKYFHRQELELLFNKSELPNKFLFTKNTSRELAKNIILGFKYSDTGIEKEENLNLTAKGEIIILWAPSSSWVFSEHFSEHYNGKFVKLNYLFKTMIKRIGALKTEELNRCVFGKHNGNVFKHDKDFLCPTTMNYILDEFKLNDYFFTEVNRLNMQPIADEYSKVLIDCVMLEENESNGVYEA